MSFQAVQENLNMTKHKPFLTSDLLEEHKLHNQTTTYSKKKWKSQSKKKSVLQEFKGVKQEVHTLLRMISGARYSGVPHNVQVLPFTRLANPKSVT